METEEKELLIKELDTIAKSLAGNRRPSHNQKIRITEIILRIMKVKNYTMKIETVRELGDMVSRIIS